MTSFLDSLLKDTPIEHEYYAFAKKSRNLVSLFIILKLKYFSSYLFEDRLEV
jgi:hypothetical protein